MSYILSMVLFLFCLVDQVVGQSKRLPPPPIDGTELSCVYRNKYSSSKRLSFYPFNASDTIKIASFRYHIRNYPINKDTLIKDSLIELKTLDKEEINQLTNILYNNFYRKLTGIDVMSLCFEPRNAILFFDKGGKLKESILICFHCSRYEISNKIEAQLGDNCTEKMDKLRKYFVAKGVKFGTNVDIDYYPGETYKDEGTIVAPPKN